MRRSSRSETSVDEGGSWSSAGTARKTGTSAGARVAASCSARATRMNSEQDRKVVREGKPIRTTVRPSPLTFSTTCGEGAIGRGRIVAATLMAPWLDWDWANGATTSDAVSAARSDGKKERMVLIRGGVDADSPAILIAGAGVAASAPSIAMSRAGVDSRDILPHSAGSGGIGD